MASRSTLVSALRGDMAWKYSRTGAQRGDASCTKYSFPGTLSSSGPSRAAPLDSASVAELGYPSRMSHQGPAMVRYGVPRQRDSWELSEETMPESVLHDRAVEFLKALLSAWA